MERMYIVILLVGVSIVDVNAWWSFQTHRNTGATVKTKDVKTPDVVEETKEEPEDAIKEAEESCEIRNVALNIAADMSLLQEHESTESDSETLCSSTWWTVDLGQNYILKEVKMHNKNDCCKGNAKSIDILVGETSEDKKRVGKLKKFKKGRDSHSVELKDVKGRYVEILQTGNNKLQLCEIEVLGIPEICHKPNRCRNGGIEHPDPSEELGYKCGCLAYDDYMFRGTNCDDSWIKVPKKLQKELSSSP